VKKTIKRSTVTLSSRYAFKTEQSLSFSRFSHSSLLFFSLSLLASTLSLPSSLLLSLCHPRTDRCNISFPSNCLSFSNLRNVTLKYQGAAFLANALSPNMLCKKKGGNSGSIYLCRSLTTSHGRTWSSVIASFDFFSFLCADSKFKRTAQYYLFRVLARANRFAGSCLKTQTQYEVSEACRAKLMRIFFF